MKDTTITFRLRDGCSEKKLDKIWSIITPTKIIESCEKTGQCLLAFTRYGKDIKDLSVFVKKTKTNNYVVQCNDFEEDN